MSRSLERKNCDGCGEILKTRDKIHVDGKVYCSLICGDIVKCKVCKSLKSFTYNINYCSTECESASFSLSSLEKLEDELLNEAFKEHANDKKGNLLSSKLNEKENLLVNKKIIADKPVEKKKSIKEYLSREDDKYLKRNLKRGSIIKDRLDRVDRDIYEKFGLKQDVSKELWYKELEGGKLIISYSCGVLLKDGKVKVLYNLNNRETNLLSIKDLSKSKRFSCLKVFIYVYDLRRSISKLNERLI